MKLLCNGKALSLIVSFTLALNFSFAQNFALSPSNTVSASIPTDTLSVHEVLIINQSANTIEMGWDLISNTLPHNWDYLFMYNGNCCPSSGMDSYGVLDTLPGNAQGYLRLSVDPLLNSGAATLKLWVYETFNPSIGDTVTFTLNALPAPVNEHTVTAGWTIHPNPSAGVVHVKSWATGVITVYDAKGKEVRSMSINDTNSTIDLDGLPAGVYHALFSTGESISDKLIIKTE